MELNARVPCYEPWFYILVLKYIACQEKSYFDGEGLCEREVASAILPYFDHLLDSLDLSLWC